MSRIPEFIEALEQMKKVHEAKNEDYASADNPFSNFDCSEYGLTLYTNNRDKTFAWPIFTKLARLATLLNGNSTPNNESVDDSFIDIANYVLLWRADVIRRRIRQKMNTAILGVRTPELYKYTCKFCQRQFDSKPFIHKQTPREHWFFCSEGHRNKYRMGVRLTHPVAAPHSDQKNQE